MEVKARSLQDYQVQIQVGQHEWISDEPVGVGKGQDRGPNPTSLMLGALAACKLITVRMYADRKGWALEDVEIRLKHQKIRAEEDKEFQSPPEMKVDLIETEIEFYGDLSQEQKERLAEISNRCPVHRTFTSETIIRSRLGLTQDVGG